MSTFTLAISCLTTSNLPWFLDLTFQYLPCPRVITMERLNSLLHSQDPRIRPHKHLNRVVLRFWALLPILKAHTFPHGVVLDVGWICVNHRGRVWPELLFWQRQTGTNEIQWRMHGYPLGTLLGSLEELCLQRARLRTLEASRKVCSKAALVPVNFSHFVCLNKMFSGYKAANLFAFLLCFIFVQDFVSSWRYSKCAKKNNGSPWIPWFGWNWLQWWHLCKYCSLQAVLSGNSAWIYMGSFLCCSLYILSSSYHI